MRSNSWSAGGSQFIQVSFEMETIEFSYVATWIPRSRAHVGVVGSGDLEVLLEPRQEKCGTITVRTNVSGFRSVWIAVLNRFTAKYQGAADIRVNDAGATPGRALLRLEQAGEVGR